MALSDLEIEQDGKKKMKKRSVPKLNELFSWSMPFPQSTAMAKAKVDTNHRKPTPRSTHLSFGGGDNDNFDLLKRNDEIMTQGQSCRARDVTRVLNNDLPLSAPPPPWLNSECLQELQFAAINNNLASSTSSSYHVTGFAPNAPSLQQECAPASASMPGSGNSGMAHFDTGNATHLDLKNPVACSSPMQRKQHKLAVEQPSCSSSFMNFPYFSRFASLSGVNAGSTTNSLHRDEPAIDHKLSVPPSAEGFVSHTPGPDPEPASATSSACSANSLERASNDVLASELKRKRHEREDSEAPPDESEEESVGVGKTDSIHTGLKRSRVARLSQRQRRRDRIDDKMRELQDLIPNCNKGDIESLLDEAIEYLKTLELQLQILPMRSGMYMSSMMLQSTMQQAYVSQFYFSPLGMGAGFGMGMHDANYNMTPMQNVQVPLFHGSVGQELLRSMPCVPPPILPNTLMNEKSDQGADFGNDQHRAVNSAGEPHLNPGVAPSSPDWCVSK